MIKVLLESELDGKLIKFKAGNVLTTLQPKGQIANVKDIQRVTND